MHCICNTPKDIFCISIEANFQIYRNTAILHDGRAKKQSEVLSHSLDLVQRRQIYGIELLETVATKSSLQMQQIENGSARMDTSLEKMSSQLQNFQNVQDNVAQQLQSLVCMKASNKRFTTN